MFNAPIYNYRYCRDSPPEVIQIPVHFMSSVRPKSAAALKIQRVFRGYLVRKSVKKLSAIRTEVSGVESSINDTETVELIRLDSKERLRVNERIMLLLLKLDSVRGVGYGVRELRKSVIRKAIAVQEKIDSVVDNNSEQVNDSLSVVADMSRIRSDETGSEVEIEIARGSYQINSEQVNETSSFRDQIVDDSTNLSAGVESVMNATVEVVKDIDVNCNPVEGEGKESVKTLMNAKVEVVKEIRVNCDSVESEGMDDDNNNNKKKKKRSIQLLEKLVDDNEKMMTLMSQMFERNEMQTRMINSLSRRVEQLEKTFGCDKPRKKEMKKKMHSV